jgi:hypothetical protein
VKGTTDIVTRNQAHGRLASCTRTILHNHSDSGLPINDVALRLLISPSVLFVCPRAIYQQRSSTRFRKVDVIS